MESDRATTKDHRYVLIASNAYSGSTLLSYLLGEHPEIATVSDVSGTRRADRMTDFQCSCRLLMRECPFWLEVRSRMRARGFADFQLADFGLGFDYSPSALRNRIRTGSLRWGRVEDGRDAVFGLWPPDARAMAELGRRNRAFAEVVLEITKARVFVDASKERLRPRYLRRYVGMEFRVIHLVRDVRGVVYSTRRRQRKAALSTGAIARHWTNTNQAIQRSLRRLPPTASTLVRYEDLCVDPEPTLRRLEEFCGVDPASAYRGEAPQQHLLGNQIRLNPISEIRLDEQWREALTRTETAHIVATAGDLLGQFYPEDDPRPATRSNMAE
jgi:hypothetical protein